VSVTLLLVLLSPFLALVLVLSVVVIVALCQARPEDVPTVTTTFVTAFSRLAERLPRPRFDRVGLPGQLAGTPETATQPQPPGAEPGGEL
jgi:hypothetical protein